MWICREDVTGLRRNLTVHPSPPLVNRMLYQRHYDSGVQQALGVRLEAICFAKPFAYCSVWVPEDLLAADHAMFTGGLRFTFAVESHDMGDGFMATRSTWKAAFALKRIWCRLRGESPLLNGLSSRKKLQERYASS